MFDESLTGSKTQTRLTRRRQRKPVSHLPRLELRVSVDGVVGFNRVPNLEMALRQARRQRLHIEYVHRTNTGEATYAIIEWRGKPVIVTDKYDGTEIH